MVDLHHDPLEKTLLRTPQQRRTATALTLGALLLILSAAGTWYSFRSFTSTVASRTYLDDALSSSVLIAEVMLAVTCLVALIVLLAALAAVRRERARHRRTEERLTRVLQTADQAGDLVTIINRRGQIEYCNRAVEQITGYQRDDLGRRRSDRWLPWYDDEQAVQELKRTVSSGASFRGEIRCRKKDGAPLLLQEQVTPLHDRRGAVRRFVSTAIDITRLRNLEERLAYLDTHDPLTGIPNRRHFAELLKRSIDDCERNGHLLSVLILDINRFKYINDLFGAATGDETLRRITGIIRSVIDEGDILARLGSDEFGVIHRYDLQHVTARIVADRIQHAVSRKFAAGGQDIVVTASVGYAVLPDDGRDAETLLNRADMALSRAKSRGRNTIEAYSKEINDRIFEFFVIDKRLNGALQNSEYRIDYQPYCDLQTKQVMGAEALIRWSNSELGTVPPMKFIPSLEESGMIVDVGAWVLRTACRQIREWKRSRRSFPVAVNLSHIQFHHKDLVTMVSGTIRELNIDPRQLTLELTESICIQDMDFTASVLKKLKEVGVSISIDDFGTGYSSLSYIKKLPVDNIKIDMSFIRDVSRDPDAASIIAAITTMARGLNLKTIAEGVESEGQRNILHLLRCDMGQGYYFSPAVPANEFENLLAARHDGGETPAS
jgi:diguanylate cyclase (GGDEF)-like protein/PAS domain S-box-containing protein